MPDAVTRLSIFDEKPEIKPYKLSELLGSVRRALEQGFRGSYKIVAEVASINRNKYSGHYYLELTETDEKGQKVAATRATLWSGVASRVMSYFYQVTGDYPKEGMEILMTVRVTFHEQYGFSLNILDIDPGHTLGNLERIRRESIARLEQAGIIDLNKIQCQLPTLTQRLAVISSETAAGWGDFRDQMRKSPLARLFHFELFPATMQGPTTTPTVIAALNQIFSRADDFDAVIILRGGGSPLDLSAFDDYQLCEYIANFTLPVITAIGHERDFSVADHVANTSVKTPTAAAEFLIHRLEDQITRVVDAGDRLHRLLKEMRLSMSERFSNYELRFSHLLRSLERDEAERMRRCERRLTSALHDLQSEGKDQIIRFQKRSTNVLYLQKTSLSAEKMRQESTGRQLQIYLTRLIPQRIEQLDSYARLIDLYSPESIMRRGFLPVLQGDRQLTSVESIKPEEPLLILLPDGRVESKVTRITKERDI